MKRATRGRSFSVEHRAVRTIKLRNCVHRELNRNDTHLAWQFIIKKEIVRSKYHSPISLINFLIRELQLLTFSISSIPSTEMIIN